LGEKGDVHGEEVYLHAMSKVYDSIPKCQLPHYDYPTTVYASGNINRLLFGSYIGYFFPGPSIFDALLSALDAS
jgi:hypothetical protein